jgi:hypothetical protein
VHIKALDADADSDWILNHVVIGSVSRFYMSQKIIYITKLLVALWADEAVCSALPSML